MGWDRGIFHGSNEYGSQISGASGHQWVIFKPSPVRVFMALGESLPRLIRLAMVNL